MFRIVMGLGALALLTGTVAAQEDPILQRQAIYKSFGRASKEPAQMLQGKEAFDLAKVQAALKVFEDGSKRLPGLFPETSKTGHDTEALPAIWEKKPEFEAMFVKFGDDSRAAMASISDEASFKAGFPKVLGDCGACHKMFRAKR